MDASFNFESEYFKGKNKIEDEEEAEELSESTDIQALLDSLEEKIKNPEMYNQEDQFISYRNDLYELLKARLETVSDLSELDESYKHSIKGWVRAILSSDERSIFHGENEFDRADDLDSKLGSKPYRSISRLIEDLRDRFKNNFWKELDLLELIPRDIFLTREGEVQSADIDLIVKKERMSDKFNEIFDKSEFFYIVYDRYEEIRPFDNFYLHGVNKNGEFQESAELKDFGGSSF